MSPIVRRLAGLGAAAVLLAGCGDAREAYDRIVAESVPCAPGDACVAAGGTDCVCPVAVNASSAAKVAEAAAAIACCSFLGGCAMVDCAAVTNPRCEAGRCASGP